MAINPPATPTPARPVAAPARTIPRIQNTPQGVVMNNNSDDPSPGGSKKKIIVISMVLIVLIVIAVLLLGVVNKPFAGLAVSVGGEDFEVAAGEAVLAGLRDSEGSFVEELVRGQEYDVEVFVGVDELDSFIFAVTTPAGVSIEPQGNAFTASGFDIHEAFIDGKYYVYGIASPAVALDGGRLGTLHLRSGMDVVEGEIGLEFSALDDAEEHLVSRSSGLEIGDVVEVELPVDEPRDVEEPQDVEEPVDELENVVVDNAVLCDQPCDVEGRQCLGRSSTQLCRDSCVVPQEGGLCSMGTACDPSTVTCQADGDNDLIFDYEDNCPRDFNPEQNLVCDVEEGVVMKADLDADNRVTLDDAILLARSVLGIIDEEFTLAQADVTGDGTVNLDDAIRIAQYTLGIVDQLEG